MNTTLSNSKLTSTTLQHKQGYLLGHLPSIWAEKFGEHPALIDDRQTITYTQLESQVASLAAGLQQSGLKQQDKVILQMNNTSQFIVTCFALFRIGVVPVLTMPAQSEQDIRRLADIANASAYIIAEDTYHTKYSQYAKRLQSDYAQVKHVWVDGKSEHFPSLPKIDSTDIKPNPTADTDVALLLISGGTTGTPKLIPRTHQDYLYNFSAAAILCDMDKGSVYLAVLPAAHNFTFGSPGILGSLSQGGTVIFTSNAGCDEAMPLIEKYKVTHTSLVPTLAQLWVEGREWEDSNLSSLKAVQIGGAKLDPELASAINTQIGPLQQVFGMAEGLLCFTRLSDDLPTRQFTQGRPLSDDDEIKIVDESLHPVADGEIGELLTRGPYTISGYYRAATHNKMAFTYDGFYRTGDLVRKTPDGNLQVMGRNKDQINRNGEKISTVEIENSLNSIASIKESVVIPVPDLRLGESSCAFIIWQDNSLDPQQLRQALLISGLAQYKLPDKIVSISYWPLTAIGKIDKKVLLTRALQSSNMAIPSHTEAKQYIEYYVEHTCDPAALSVAITQDEICSDYMIYEKNEEWSLAINPAYSLSIDHNAVLQNFNGDQIQLTPHELCSAIDSATKTIPVNNWRLYGRVDFEFCRFTHNLQQTPTERSLLSLFVPETEIRITKAQLHIRTLNTNALPDIQKAIQKVLHKSQFDVKSTHVYSQKEIVAKTNIKEHYHKVVASAVEEIKAGKYQKVILSRQAELPIDIQMAENFLFGRLNNTPARSFLLSMDNFSAYGFSPETVLEVDNNNYLSTQPLAGTRALPVDPEQARQLKQELLTDPKEIAEHAMSVKLALEELENVCSINSVHVTEFMSVVERGSVQHLASRVSGQLADGKSRWDAFKMVFPAITASGIPKRESIKAIAQHELTPRGLYSGCVLIADESGMLDAALVLRSAYRENHKLWLQAGAGIVGLSTPEREWEETCEKMSCVLNNLITTNEVNFLPL